MGMANGWSVEFMHNSGRTWSASDAQPWFDIRSEKLAYKINITICQSPTGNCQLKSIGYLNTLLHTLAGKADQSTVKAEDVTAILRECFRLLGGQPVLLLLDVQVFYCPTVDRCFNVQEKHLYTNGNGSAMCLYLARLKG